jgi:hypothetical protein
VKSIQLTGDPDWLYATAGVSGPYSGTVIGKCKPTYDNTTKRFSLHELSFELGEDNFLAKLAGKFVNNFIAEKVDGKLEEAVNEKFTGLVDDILRQLAHIDLPEGARLSFDSQSFNLYDVRTGADGMHFTAELTGIASMQY